MRARARVRAEAGAAGTRLAVLRSDPPVALRSAADAVYLVGSAAGPIGGDDLTVDVEVGDGAELTVRTVAASVALPGPGGAISRVRVHATVGAGATLRWLPEPLVAAAGCDHRAVAQVRLDAGARLEWQEELVLGRHGEAPGRCQVALRVDLDGRPLLRHELRVGGASGWDGLGGPGWPGPRVLGLSRAAGSLVLAGGRWAPAAAQPCGPTAAHLFGPTAAVLPLAGPGVLVSVLADDAPTLRAGLETGRQLSRGAATVAASPQVRAPSQGAAPAAHR